MQNRQSARVVHAETLNNWLFAGLSVVIALAPLPFGSARPWAWGLMAVIVALLLLLSLTIPQSKPFYARTLKVPFFLLLTVILVVVFQVSSLGPDAWNHPVWDVANVATAYPVVGSIAINPEEALNSATRWLAYAGIFYMSYSLAHSRSRAYAAIRVVTLTGSIYASYGLLVYWFGNTTILWFEKWTYLADLTGPFVNRNSFATYLGLASVTTLAELYIGLERLHWPHSARDRFLVLSEFVSEKAWLLICLFLTTTALVLTHSRGGFTFTLIGVIVLFLAIYYSQRRSQRAYLRFVILPIALFGLAFLVSGTGLVSRMLESGGGAFGRIAIFETTLTAITERPFLGTGPESFPSVFAAHRTTAIPTGFIDKAHSDYLEMILELGIPAAILLFAIFIWLIGCCIRGVVVRRRDALFSCLGLSASAIVVAHSALDFSLQIPAVAAIYFYLLGIALGQSHPTRVISPVP